MITVLTQLKIKDCVKLHNYGVILQKIFSELEKLIIGNQHVHGSSRVFRTYCFTIRTAQYTTATVCQPTFSTAFLLSAILQSMKWQTI